MALVDLASQTDGPPVALAEIAERQEISLSDLEQLFAKLRRSGLVKSVRGPGGGYLLAYHRDETRIADIILAVDELARPAARPARQGCRANKSRCLTHDPEELGNQSISSELGLAGGVCSRRVLGQGRIPTAPAKAIRRWCPRAGPTSGTLTPVRSSRTP
jgi:Rrf2 family iron-sulfur cluster assembly transcriptional regulator